MGQRKCFAHQLWKHLADSTAELCTWPPSKSPAYISQTPLNYVNISLLTTLSAKDLQKSCFLCPLDHMQPSSLLLSAAPGFLNLLLHSGFRHPNPLFSPANTSHLCSKLLSAQHSLSVVLQHLTEEGKSPPQH